jgi:hypothetical protein
MAQAPLGLNDDSITSQSIRAGTERLLDVINDQVGKAVMKSRDDLSNFRAEASRTEASLRDQCRKLESSLQDARSELEQIRSVKACNHPPDMADRLDKLLLALENAGFVVDSNNVIRFGSMVSTLALEVDGIANQILEECEHRSLSSLAQHAVSGFCTLDFMQTTKQFAEEYQNLLAVWKQKHATAEQERDEERKKVINLEAVLKDEQEQADRSAAHHRRLLSMLVQKELNDRFPPSPSGSLYPGSC